MSRTVKDPDIRRGELLDTALDLFSRHGYHDTSVQAITDAAGVAKGLFYHYFASKDELLDQLAERESERIFSEVRARSREIEGRPLEELASLLGMLARWNLDDARGLTGALLHAMYEDGNSDLRDRLMHRYSQLLVTLITELIDEGNSLGQMDVADPEATAWVIAGMWNGMREELIPLLLDTREDPANIARVVRGVEASERAAERVLGAAPGSLHIYDHDAYQDAFLALVTAASRGQSTGGASR